MNTLIPSPVARLFACDGQPVNTTVGRWYFFRIVFSTRKLSSTKRELHKVEKIDSTKTVVPACHQAFS
jgi:hypothetical protein